jgi:hypothetical protein
MLVESVGLAAELVGLAAELAAPEVVLAGAVRVAGALVVVRGVLAAVAALERLEPPVRELARLEHRGVPRLGLEHRERAARRGLELRGLELRGLELRGLARQVLAFRGVDTAGREEQDLREEFPVLLRELVDLRLLDLLEEATLAPQAESQGLLQVWVVAPPVLMARVEDTVVPLAARVLLREA